MSKRNLSLIVSILIFILYSGNIVKKTPPPVVILPTPTKIPVINSNSIATSSATVTRTIDGDTIKLDTGQSVRYIGIDTPETVDPRKPVQCYGKEASERNKQLVEGKTVILEKDISETDRYGRLLRYVWIDDTLVNEQLVREGYAHSSTYPPDIKYQDRFNMAEKLARTEKLGLWADECD
jgi:micrococcal nuclease